MEDQLGTLGLILNCGTLWNTGYLNAALEQLRAQDRPVSSPTSPTHACAALTSRAIV